MKKIAIFNVGGALSVYCDIDNINFMIDLGSGNEFSPTNDFLLPLARKGKIIQSTNLGHKNRYRIDQLFISHLDKDHISDFLKFNEYFHPYLLTVPSNHSGINSDYQINTDKVPDNEIVKKILSVMNERNPSLEQNSPSPESPLAVFNNDTMYLTYILPKRCEYLDQISDEEHPHYPNNISLVLYLRVNGHSILLPGDIMKDGMENLIDTDVNFKDFLQSYGVDFLIAPHHGLDTSFSQYLFQTIHDNKVKLNIISEKTSKADSSENRHPVDTRYYSSDYATGYSVENGAPGLQYGIKTSRGHIVIDLEASVPTVKRCHTNEELLYEFL